MEVTCPNCQKKMESNSILGTTRCSGCGKGFTFDHEKYLKYQRELRENNRERMREYYRRWYKRNPERRRELARKKYARTKKKLKTKLIQQLGGKCLFCGETTACCLDVHHKNGERKTERSKLLATSSLKRQRYYLKEIDKLILVCTNCHRKLHAKLISLP